MLFRSSCVVRLAVVLLASGSAVRASDPASASSAPVARADAGGERPWKVVRGWPFLSVERGPGDRRAVDVLFPLFHRTTSASESATRMAPLFFAAATADEAWSVLAPLYYYRRDDGGSSLFSLAFSRTATADGASAWRAPWPVPLYRGRPSAGQHRVGLWPLGDLTAVRSNEHERVVDLLAFPGTGEAGDSWLRWARYRRQADVGITDLSFLPLWYYHRGEEGASRFAVPVAGWLRRKDADGTWDGFLPLLADYRRNVDGYRWRVLLGLLGSGRDAASRRLSLEPFYSYYEDADVRKVSWLRAYGREWRSDGYRAVKLLEPLGLFARTPDGYRQRFAPFYFAGSRRDSAGGVTSYRTLMPFYLSRHDPERSRSFVFPSYVRSRSAEGLFETAFPLWWRIESTGARVVALAPLYLRHRSTVVDGMNLTLVAGSLWLDYERRDRRERGVLWPFTRYVVDGESRRLDALGLFSTSSTLAGESALRLSPFFSSRRDGEGPSLARWCHLVSYERGDWGHEARVMPFLFSRRSAGVEERATAAFGLVHRARDTLRSEAWVLPFYYSLREGEPAWPRRRTLAALPFYFYARKDAQETTIVAPPIYVREVERGTWRRDSVLWPFFGYERGEQHFDVRAWPLGSYGATRDGATDTRFSLLYRHYRAAPGESVRSCLSTHGFWGTQLVRTASGESSRTVTVHPFLFGYHRNEASEHLQWNALWFNRYHRTGDRSSLSILGGINARNSPERRWFSAFPFVFLDERRADPLASLTLPEAFHVFFRGEDAHHSRWALLGRLASGSKERVGGAYSFRILHKFVSFVSEESYTERAFRPFVTWEEDRAAGSHYRSFLTLLYVDSKAGFDAPRERRLLGIPLPAGS